MTFSVERDLGANGVNYPDNTFQATDGVNKGYAGINNFPDDPKRIAAYLEKVDKQANGANWESYLINEKNYTISQPSCDLIGSPAGKMRYKFTVTPLPGRKELSGGELWIDGNGIPLEFHGNPNLVFGLEKASYHQTYTNLDGHILIDQVTLETTTKFIHETCGSSTVDFDNKNLVATGGKSEGSAVSRGL